MQLTAVFFLACALSVSARTVSQTVTLTGKGIPMKTVFAQIEAQTGYVIVGNSDKFDRSETVDVAARDMALEDFLQLVFKNKPLAFEIKSRTIFLRRKPVIVEPLNGPAALPPVRGVIRDASGQPVSGVNVVVKGTGRGVVSGADGAFSIEVSPGQTLIFSSVGFTDKEIKIKDESTLNITLEKAVAALEEVVVNKGVYTTSKILNTGTVSSVKAAEIAKQPVSDPLLALQGKVPGLYLFQSRGVPGAGMVVRLRGRNSIANGNDPLYIVDGVPFNSNNLSQNTNAAGSNLSPFMSIRPEDIESIDVLKDADATAIYGSRGANGVILITTKKGKAGNTRFDANFSKGLAQVAHYLDLMNTAEYVQMRKEAYANDGYPVPQAGDPIDYSNYDLLSFSQTKYTDWQKKLIGGTAQFTNAQAALSGGNQLTQFLLSGSYRRETTVFPGNFNNSLGSMLANIEHTSDNKKFKANFSANYSKSNNKLPILDLTSYILMAPNAPDPYNSDGTLNWDNGNFDNPYALLKQRINSKTTTFRSNLNLSYEILEGLSLAINSGYNETVLREQNIKPITASNPAYSPGPQSRINDQSNNTTSTWTIDPQINYTHTVGAHSFNALIGSTWQQTITDGSFQRFSGFSSDDVIENIAAATTKGNPRTNFTDYRYNGVYGRLGYAYKERYIVNLTGRRDGSSRFGPGKQFGNFGAVGAAWVASNENFFPHSTAVSFLKVKGSVGKTGNDKLLDYEFLSAYTPSGSAYLNLVTLAPKSLTNPYYGWETINKIEAGLEAAFINNRINLNLNWYRNRTANQLVGYNLPATSGFTTIRANLPAVIQNSGFEVDISATNIQSSHFTWSTSLNFSKPKNKLIAYPGLESSPYSQAFVIGMPLFIQYVFRFKNVDPDTGLFTFEDLDKDGTLTYDKDRVPVFVGQKWFGYLNNSLAFKNFTLDFSLQYVRQTGINPAAYNFMAGATNFSQPKDVVNRWQKQGDVKPYQKYTQDYTDGFTAALYYGQSDAMISDASFLRLKNVFLSWSVPATWLSSKKLRQLKLFVQGQNIFTVTSFKGLDPETQGVSSGITLPSLRTLSGGINLSF